MEKLTLPLGSNADSSSSPQSEIFLMPKLHKIWLRSVELVSMSCMVKVSMARSRSAHSLASFLQLKSVIGAALVTQARRVVVMERGGRSERWRCIKKRTGKQNCG